MHIEIYNFYIAILGWLVWNIGVFSFTKDEYDDTGKVFPFKSYANEHWDNWLFSLVMVPVILIIGDQGFGMDALAVLEIKMKWSNLYYFGSGFFAEALRFIYKRWRKKQIV